MALTVDLHTHSTASDGSDPPARLVALALEVGLGALALTDHDTQEGLAEAFAAAEGTGLELIPGVELSLAYEAGAMHLIVLWLEPGRGPLQDRLGGLQSGRTARNAEIVSRLNSAGMELTLEEVEEMAGGGTVGRPHIAAVLMERGYVPDIHTAFELWLGQGRPAYADRERLGPEEAIALARESGAVPVLSHPHTLGITTGPEMAALLTRLRRAGLVGLEAVYGSYRRHEREGYSDLARRFDLVPSGGSDYHGTYKPGLGLGRGFGDLAVPLKLMEELRTRVGTP
ncbi:MAG TPA: PHP domain-containing protein [Acidimicrobiia bacterium]|nr:PHP domain-containing protein [Acidimicrobiia bacterium]